MIDERQRRAIERLQQFGLRSTPQRRAIWNVFAQLGQGHLTAEEVLDRAQAELPELSRATVYKTLGEFVRVGLLRTVAGHGPLRFDPNLDASHHHFICERCQQIVDVHLTGIEQLRLQQPGLRVHRIRILVEGRCAACAAEPDA
ncbi:MAG: transcriptional repressor [Chloroflexi bacterium]|nr:transcriptional repressor [Chloroflexota bacterium]GIW11341.1 MAG: transcriptional repressor [Dehalococcoidia bacterium]